MPARRPISFDHWPAQMTIVSQATMPRSVTTPAARPSFSASPVTATSSTMRTPPCRAPLASDSVMSEGLAWPSVGRYAAPTTSEMSISGHSFSASVGVMRCMSRPKERAVVAWRLISIMRCALQASRRPPFIFQPVAWPVSASRVR